MSSHFMDQTALVICIYTDQLKQAFKVIYQGFKRSNLLQPCRGAIFFFNRTVLMSTMWGKQKELGCICTARQDRNATFWKFIKPHLPKFYYFVIIIIMITIVSIFISSFVIGLKHYVKINEIFKSWSKKLGRK